MISMILFERSACGGTFSIGEMGPVGRRSLPAELLPDPIYAKIGPQAGITCPVCEWVIRRNKQPRI